MIINLKGFLGIHSDFLDFLRVFLEFLKSENSIPLSLYRFSASNLEN
jgi:hypothetical protein